MSNSKLDFNKFSKEVMISIFEELRNLHFIHDITDFKRDIGKGAIKTKDYIILIDYDQSVFGGGGICFFTAKTDEDIKKEKQCKLAVEMRAKEAEIKAKEAEIMDIEKKIKDFKKEQDEKLKEWKDIEITLNKESQSTT